MHIAIRSTEDQKEELIQKGLNNNIHVEWINEKQRLLHTNADVYFDLLFNDADISSNYFIENKPVFVHAVNCVCKEINKANYIRLNAWNGFLSRSVIELVCCSDVLKENAKEIFDELNWQFAFVADDYGFVAARIIAMIINEAYYALEENVSTKEQIDTAMKLGTNYPYGPFEWSKKIGLHNIVVLLEKLSKHNKRYTISSLLVYESQQF
ncbi:MAG: 3-hydroxyacyl-CoA dehydrogenase family protein [Parafilimonas sp.]